MLRIRVVDESEMVTLYVEGKLAGDVVNELRRVWSCLRDESPGKEIVVDLASVRVVDCTARKLRCQMHGWATQSARTGLMIRPLIEEITNAASSSDVV